MASDYEKLMAEFGYSANPMGDLMNMINSMSQNRARKNQQERYVGSFYDELNEGTKSFDNSEIDFHQKRARDYYNENIDKMDDVSIDRFQALDEQYEYQKQKNNDYAVSKSQIYDFKDNILSLADKYSAADDLSSFSWDINTVNADGELVTKTNFVNVPEDMNSQEYKQFFSDVGGAEGYAKKKEEYKMYLKNEIERSIGAYSDHQDQMMQKHGDRLTNRAFYGDVMEIEGLDKAYSFVIDSMTDDGLFDDTERSAFLSAITQKKYAPIANFIAQDREVRNSARNRIIGEMNTLKAQGDMLQSHAGIIDEVLGADANTFMSLEGQPAINIGTAKKEDIRTYGEIRNALRDKGVNDELYQYLMSVDSETERIKEELKEKDNAFMKNDGESYLQTMQDDEWTKNLYKQQPKGFVLGLPGGIEDLEDKIREDKKIIYGLEHESNVSKVIQDIETDRGVSLKDWEKGVINNETEKMDKLHEQLLYFKTKSGMEGKIKDYDDTMKAYENIKAQLKEAKQSLASGMLRIDDPLIDNLQAQMNAIEHKYTAAERIEIKKAKKQKQKIIDYYNAAKSKIENIKSK